MRRRSSAAAAAVILLAVLLLRPGSAGSLSAAAAPETKAPTSAAAASKAAPAPAAAASKAAPAPAAAVAAPPDALLPVPPPLGLPANPPTPQSVAQVLLDLYQKHAGPVIKAASNMLSYGLQQAEAGPLQLPQCKQTNVLMNAGHFPGPAFANLTAEQQAVHPINVVMLQLAYSAYRPLSDLKSCLTGMGADLSTLVNVTVPISEFSTNKHAYVFRAGRERVFVLFRGSGETDLVINVDCRQEPLPRELFGLSSSSSSRAVPQLHRGYWRAWQSMEKGVVAAVQDLLKEVPSKEVYIVGHSLGAALASVAAMRLNTLLPHGVAGVWLFAAPRAGNAAWAAAYNSALLHKTVRFSNYLDFAVRVPAQVQACSLGGLSLTADTGRFEYAHVGRAVLMCPDKASGLTQLRVSPHGTENLDCFGADELVEVDATATTHQLGSYFDAWRRGHLFHVGGSLAADARVQAVLCHGCLISTARFRMQQIRSPARAGGPVTCAVDATCSSPLAFGASLTVGGVKLLAPINVTMACKAFTCQAAGGN